MSNGTFEVKSADITRLYKTIVGANPVQQHYTMDCGGFAAIVTKRGQKSILFYNFNRSIKPLARIPEGGEVVIMRDYFTEKELQDYMIKLAYLTKPLLEVKLSEHVHAPGIGNLYRETISDDAPRLNLDFKDGLQVAAGAAELLRHSGMIPQGLGRNPKVCDPHRQ